MNASDDFAARLLEAMARLEADPDFPAGMAVLRARAILSGGPTRPLPLEDKEKEGE